ncbi:helix-turn-helix transcriptional regulator [Myroides sp. LJL119]
MIDINTLVTQVPMHPPNQKVNSSAVQVYTSRYYFYIYDCLLDKIIPCDAAFENATGHGAENLNWNLFKKLIHQQDRQQVTLFRKKAAQFAEKSMDNNLFKYVISFNFRLQNSHNQYVNVIEKRQVIEITGERSLSKILIQHQILPCQNSNFKQEFKILDLSTNQFIDNLECFKLTKREIEIIHFIKQGDNSNEIADKLSVSKNTIITHRRNILAKTNCRTFVELIQKFNTSNSIK